jgi:hypothetical protein
VLQADQPFLHHTRVLTRCLVILYLALETSRKVRFYCSVFFIAQDTLGVHFSKLREHVTCAHLVFFRTTAQPSHKKDGEQAQSCTDDAKRDRLLDATTVQEIQHCMMSIERRTTSHRDFFAERALLASNYALFCRMRPEQTTDSASLFIQLCPAFPRRISCSSDSFRPTDTQMMGIGVLVSDTWKKPKTGNSIEQ